MTSPATHHRVVVETRNMRKHTGMQGGQGLDPGNGRNPFKQQAVAIAFLKSLVDAKEYSENQLGLFAQEIAEGGIRQFFVDTFAGFALGHSPFFAKDAAEHAQTADCTFPSLKGLPHMYEVILEDRPCCLYFDLEFQTDLNPGLTGEAAMDAFRSTLSSFVHEVIGARLDPAGIVELDSSTGSKFSKHVLVRELGKLAFDSDSAELLNEVGKQGVDNTMQPLIFSNNAQAGLFVREFVAFARRKRDEARSADPPSESLSAKLFINAKRLPDDNQDVSFIDESVYSRNRCFRLLFHTKFGKHASLQIDRPGNVLPKFPPSLQLLYSMASFVPSGESLFQHPIIPAGCRHEALKRTRFSLGRVGTRISSVGASEFPQNGLVQYLLESWDRVRQKQELDNIVGPSLGRNCFVPARVQSIVEVADDVFAMTLAGNHFCLCKGATHKSNHIYLVVDRLNRSFRQKCFDDACKNFVSVSFPIPEVLMQESLSNEDDDDPWATAAEVLDSNAPCSPSKRLRC